jgi:hypothetical protein
MGRAPSDDGCRPDAGTIEIYNGSQAVTLKGYVEIRLERDKDKRDKRRLSASRL